MTKLRETGGQVIAEHRTAIVGWSGIAFRNESPLRGDADEALLQIREDGTYAQIKQKWFGAENSPSNG